MTKTGKEIVIVSGMSGSGKSIAIHALEDIGYFCIDNLPLPMLDSAVKMLTSENSTFDRIALVMDSRDRALANQGQAQFKAICCDGFTMKILYLECSNEILARRFKITRRVHPLAVEGSVPEGIAKERIELAWLRQAANVRIDTSETNVHQLRDRIQEIFGDREPVDLNLTLVSFGYKYGLPYDADLVVDVRFLPNPHWVPELKPKSGQDQPVADYVFQVGHAKQFLQRFSELLDFLLPFYRKEGKHYLTVAVGCTGGRHRSVAVAEAIGSHFAGSSFKVSVLHRDMNKASQ